MNKGRLSAIQTEMFEGGHNLLTVRFVMHLAGQEGVWSSGWTITDTVTGDWVESKVSGERHRITTSDELCTEVNKVYERALSHLKAF